MFTQKKKLGLALGSGGFRGPAHIGVIKALVKNGIKIDFLSGSSIGALIAAHYATFQDVELLEEVTFGNQKEKASLLFDISRGGGLLTGNRVERFFKKILDNAKFETAKIPLKIISTDLITGDPFIFQKGDLNQAVRASISIPFVFRPMKFKDKQLIDGGVSNPVPDDVVRDMGAEVVISVNLYEHYKFDFPKAKTAKVGMRGLEIMLTNLANSNTRHTDILLQPKTAGDFKISRLKKYYDKTAIENMIEAGERAVEEKIDEIKKLLG